MAKRTGSIALPGLRNARQNAGWSIRDLETETEKSGKKVYRSTISDLELGHRGAHPRTARKLADVLRVQIVDLRKSVPED